MLYWFCKFRALNPNHAECWAMARYAIRYNRSLGRSIYHAVRVGVLIIGE